MAHFAEIDAGNVVRRVVVVPNDQEHRGQEYLSTDLGLGGTWIQTSYNSNIRKNYAVAGAVYDEQRNAFIRPKPYSSWVFDEETCQWNAPTPMPKDDKLYRWDEETISWKELN